MRFSLSNSKYFLILNPDVQIEANIINELIKILVSTNTKLISPIIVTNNKILIMTTHECFRLS